MTVILFPNLRINQVAGQLDDRPQSFQLFSNLVDISRHILADLSISEKNDSDVATLSPCSNAEIQRVCAIPCFVLSFRCRAFLRPLRPAFSPQ